MNENDKLQSQEIDMLVSQNVMRNQVVVQKKGAIKERTISGSLRPLRPYSKDIGAAWEVAERLGITLIPVENGQWFALVGRGERWKSPGDFLKFLETGDFTRGGAAVAETAPMAICLAALTSLAKPKEESPEPPTQLAAN